MRHIIVYTARPAQQRREARAAVLAAVEHGVGGLREGRAGHHRVLELVAEVAHRHLELHRLVHLSTESGVRWADRAMPYFS